MKELLVRWLSSREPQITLIEDNDEINFHRNQHSYLISVQLTHHRTDPKSLEAWARLGQASLNHFQGALAQDALNGRLWLIQKLPDDCDQNYVFTKLEALLNQRDAWRAVTARLIRPTLKLTPTSLRSLPH